VIRKLIKALAILVAFPMIYPFYMFWCWLFEEERTVTVKDYFDWRSL
jgi:hypothetical protein